MKKAFTLIELLIVIAILGILAAGILIALDPVEQTKRATDSTVQQSSIEVKDAINRFYASKFYFPWCDATSTQGTCSVWAGSGCTADATTNFGTAGSCAAYVLTQLGPTVSGELKANPPPNIVNKLNLTTTGTGTAFSASFIPDSKSFKSRYTTTLGQAGIYVTTSCAALGTSGTCPVTSTTCAYCVQ